MFSTQFMTVRKFLVEQQSMFPKATGEFTSLLLDIILGCKNVGYEIRKFGLSQYQSLTGEVNVQDEEVHELDELADKTLVDLLLHSGEVCAVASEERKDIVLVPDGYPRGDYVVMLDPLDGFSNITVNINIGTIFSVRKKVSKGIDGTLEDFLQTGRNLVCAGYVMYGSSIVLVMTTGQGVHMFTFNGDLGEFILSKKNIMIPIGKSGKLPPCFSVNSAYWNLWDWEKKDGEPSKTAEVIKHLIDNGYADRHVGSLVADFHRNLFTGGMFAYPANKKSPKGKLRLLCELQPMAYLLEQAGGRAIDGTRNILDIKPDELQQRSPVFMGSIDAVDAAKKILAG